LCTSPKYLQDKIAKSIAILSKIRHYVNIDVKLSLYYALIYSHLNYAFIQIQNGSKQ